MNVKRKNKILFKYFILLFLISFLFINWQEVSWVFNYKEISGLVSGIFKTESLAKDNTIEGDSRENSFSLNTRVKNESSIEIPKMGLSVPLIFPENKKADFEKLLDKGALFFPTSSLPGNPGQTIILGHSAPPGWPKIKHDWIFTRISELNKGDKIIIYFHSRKYTYSVSGKLILAKGEEVPDHLKISENVLVLLSCWPPGKNYKRMAIAATLDKF